MNRREFLASATLTASAALLAPRPSHLMAQTSPHQAPGDFDFVFLTDTHIQPELDAAHGCAMAFKKISTLKADFAIQGGDHIFDGLGVNRARADQLFDLYGATEQAIGLKVHHTIGNHDHFALFAKSGVEANAPGYAKAMYQDRIGATYYSFDHKGYHFIVLDSIQPTADRSWEAVIDDAQLAWLKADLAKLPAGRPIVVSVHVPLASGILSYGEEQYHAASSPAIIHPQIVVSNAHLVLDELQKHNTLAVLQGHTHINERVSYRGIEYITSGAVSGNWWRGTRWGTPEGFTVVSLRSGKLTTRYETYGFHSIDPQNT